MSGSLKREECVAVGLIGIAAGGRRACRAVSVGPDFWNALPSDPAAFTEAARHGAGIVIVLDVISPASRLVKEKYGAFCRRRLLRRLGDWRRDRVAFIKQYSPRLSSAMRIFERDYLAAKAELDGDYCARLRALPRPPEGYYWNPDGPWALSEEDFEAGSVVREVRLWNDAFGVMPSCRDIDDMTSRTSYER